MNESLHLCLKCNKPFTYNRLMIEQLKNKIENRLNKEKFNSLNEQIIIKNNFLELYKKEITLCPNCSKIIYNEILLEAKKNGNKNFNFTNILDFFFYINYAFVFNLSEYLYIDWKNEDILFPSLLNYFNITEDEIENSSISFINDFEKSWFLLPTNYCSLPNYIKKEYIFKEFIGNDTKEQGKYNGPDFVLINSKNNETIGIELTQAYKEMYPSMNFKGASKVLKKNLGLDLEQADSKFENKDEKINIWAVNTERLLLEFLDKAIEIVDQKIESSKKYQWVDELIICIGINSKVPGEYLNFIEKNTNAYVRRNKEFYINSINTKNIRIVIM